MRFLDKFIRYWRVEFALRQLPKFSKTVFDIGCDDGYLLNKLSASVAKKHGIDPRLTKNIERGTAALTSGNNDAIKHFI